MGQVRELELSEIRLEIRKHVLSGVVSFLDCVLQELYEFLVLSNAFLNLGDEPAELVVTRQEV